MMEVLLGRLGITPETTIVLYDNRNSRLAARMFWSLRYYDHEDVRILNGGVAAWEAAGHQLTSEVESKSTTAYEITGINEDYRADKAFIQSRLGDDGFTLVDGRSKEQYTGEAHGTVFGTGIEHQKKRATSMAPRISSGMITSTPMVPSSQWTSCENSMNPTA